jgi:hypothetical protein
VDINFDCFDQFFHGYLIHLAGMRHPVAIIYLGRPVQAQKAGSVMAAEAKAWK